MKWEDELEERAENEIERARRRAGMSLDSEWGRPSVYQAAEESEFNITSPPAREPGFVLLRQPSGLYLIAACVLLWAAIVWLVLS